MNKNHTFTALKKCNIKQTWLFEKLRCTVFQNAVLCLLLCNGDQPTQDKERKKVGKTGNDAIVDVCCFICFCSEIISWTCLNTKQYKIMLLSSRIIVY
jgi:hypothetical protein